MTTDDDRLTRTLAEAYANAAGKPMPDPALLVETQARWDREDEEKRRAQKSMLQVRHLECLGLPEENRHPLWSELTGGYRSVLFGYCEHLDKRLVYREGLYLGAGIGAGKTSALALVALRAEQLGISCAYVLAGFELAEACAKGSEPYADFDLLLVDDLDYVSTAGYDGELRSWDVIGRYLYRRYANRGAVCIASNLPYGELAKKPGMDRAASRWEQRMPPAWRVETQEPDRRVVAQ